MKKTLVKIFCLVLTVLMVLSIAGCGKTADTVSDTEADFDLGGSGETADNSGGSDTDTSSGADVDVSVPDGSSAAVQPKASLDSLSWNQLLAQMPKELRGTTITVCSWNPAKEVTGAEGVIANFEKATGIKVNWQQVSYDNYTDKIAALVNAGNAPDLIRYYAPDIHRMYLCSDVQSATGYDFKGDIWDSRVTSKYTIKGKIYGVNLKNTFVNQPKVIMYKKSVIEKTKLEDPYVLWKNGQWNWSKFISLCNDFLEATNGTGYPWISYNAVDYMDFSGYSLINFDGSKFTTNVSDANVEKTLKQMCTYVKQKIVSSAVRDQKIFPGGNALFMTFNSIANRKTNANLMTVKQENDLYCVPIAAIKGRENVQTFSELEAYGIPKGAKNAAAVYYFLRYYLDANNYDANNFFTNKQAYEVYQSCMSKKEFAVNSDDELLQVAAGDSGLAGLSDWIRNGGDSAQLAKELATVKPKFELAVKKANEKLAKF